MPSSKRLGSRSRPSPTRSRPSPGSDDSKIDYPPHYTYSEIEPLDVIEAWRLGYHLGNVVKYLARHQRKGTPLEDLKKARFYLDRVIVLWGRRPELADDPRALTTAELEEIVREASTGG